MSRPKIALIGGGQIGGNLALLAAQKELGDIVIFDIPKAEGMVQGKALDLMQLRPHDGYDADISGTSDWNDLKDTNIFIMSPNFAVNCAVNSSQSKCPAPISLAICNVLQRKIKRVLTYISLHCSSDSMNINETLRSESKLSVRFERVLTKI